MINSSIAMELNDRPLDVEYKLPLGNGIPNDPFVSVWASIVDDPELAPYATSIDYMMCGSTIVIFGLVDSQEIKDAVERKIRPFAKGRPVQNKIIVKVSTLPVLI